ncbi:hypothetical protein BCY84_16280 [Trypanosoma cruzi cruzi]|nr:hypothetical protein TcBrA4_0004960 [Trypanosoma cruzi]PBJ71851.1 hypothetical protein BCY84_16280 [Trypanosoma cruzi cruzi]
MRDVLMKFLEASAASGAWESALAVWRTTAVEDVAVSGSHTLLLTRMLVQAGKWREAKHVVMSDAASVCPQRLSARLLAMLAAMTDANGWSEACQLLQDGQICLEKHGSEQRSTLQSEVVGLAESFERCVVPHIPASQQEPWVRLACEMRRDDLQNRQRPSLEETRGGDTAADAAALTNNEELLHIYRSPKSRSSWTRALQTLLSMHHPNAASVNITLGILSRQGRQREAVDVITKFMVSREIHPTAVTVKTITEAANTMRSGKLCHMILSTPALRDQITPSSAVPLVRTLQRIGDWRSCLSWWDSLLPTTESSVPPSNHGGKAELRRNLRLSSYVAVCVAQGGRWSEALAAMRDASAHDPSLAVLFALRALRVAGAWKAALSVFHCKKNVWENSSVDLQVREVMTRQNAESWVPLDKLQTLRSLYGA